MAAHETLYGACQGAAAAEFLVDAMDEATYAEILTCSSRNASLSKASQVTDRAERSCPARCCTGLCYKIGFCCLWTCGKSFWRNVQTVFFEDEGTEHGEYSEAELKLRKDMAANKIVWYGEYWKDFWCFTRNTNPILALCYSHPLHPISRKERIVITVLQIVFIMMVSSAIPKAQQQCLRDGRARHAAISGNDESDRFCRLAGHVGMTWSLENMSLGFHFGGSIYALVVNFIFAQILFQFGANCACCQFLKKDLRRFAEFLGHLLMAVILVAMLPPTWLFMSYNIYHHTLDSVMVTFLTSKPLSVLLTTVVQSTMFSILWLRESSAASDKPHAKFYVTASDYWAMVKRKAAVSHI